MSKWQIPDLSFERKWYVFGQAKEAGKLESCLGEWTPRNVLRRAATAASEVKESVAETLRNVLIPRLVRVLAPFPEARAAVVAMFLEMHKAGVEIPGCASEDRRTPET